METKNINGSQHTLLHWVKSHIGITGNEIADRTADKRYKNDRIVLYSITNEESFSILKKKQFHLLENHLQYNLQGIILKKN